MPDFIPPVVCFCFSCSVGDTITCALEGREEPLPTPGVAPPTLGMMFGVNTGPLQGKSGTKVTGVLRLPDKVATVGACVVKASHLRVARCD